MTGHADGEAAAHSPEIEPAAEQRAEPDPPACDRATGPAQPAEPNRLDEDLGPAPLSVRLIENAVMYPTIRVGSRPGELFMGVFDRDGAYVDGSALDRRSGEKGSPVPRLLYGEPVDATEPEAIYAGTLYFHFGHFLLESLARSWYARQHPELPFVWAGSYCWQDKELQDWQLEILDILGIANPTRILAAPARFDLLHVPDIGYRYDDTFHPEHAAFLGNYAGPAQEPGRKLWLSRSAIESDVRDLNGVAIEHQLTRVGWNIVHPETLTVREQLDHLARAELVAGEEGSAFHTLMLLKDVSAKRFHIFRRYGREHGNMRTIGKVRGVNQQFTSLTDELVLSAEGRAVSKLSPSSAEVLTALRVPVPKATTTPPAPPGEAIVARAIAELAPESYLDVGAASPYLVFGCGAPFRVAVSQNFDFDPRSYTQSEAHLDVELLELDLATYLEFFHGDRGPFDLIRIAGRSVAEMMVSFELSEFLAHDDTTWILGSDRLAAEAALAVRGLHPGYAARRLFVPRRPVYVVKRAPGSPLDEEGFGRLPAAEVERRARRLPPAGVVGVRPWLSKGVDTTLGKQRADRLRAAKRSVVGRFEHGSG